MANNSESKKLIIANQELALLTKEKDKLLAQLVITNNELATNLNKNKKTEEALIFANKKLVFQNKEKDKREVALNSSNDKLYKTEIRLNKVNRLYSFLSQINKTILKAKDEQTLYNEACRIAVEIGKFKMAWIGIADISKCKIKLIASNGATDEDIKLLSDKTFHIEGLTDKILQGKEYYAIPNIQANDIIKWQDYAAARGFISVVSLPMKKSGKVIGTFDMYSSETNLFIDEEIDMLKEVADDISFGITLFEKEKQQQKTEIFLLENEKLFRALIEHSVDMKTLTTREGNALYCSPSVEKSLGYSLEEFLNLYPLGLIHPDDIESYLQKRDAILKTPGKSFDFKQRRRHKSGNWIWCEGFVTNLLYEDGIHALVSNFRDITEQKRAEETIKKTEQHLHSVYNTVADTIFVLEVEPNERYRFSSVNKSFQTITGIPYAMVVDKYVDEILPQASLNFVLEKYKEAIEMKQIVRWEETSQYPTGELIGEVNVAPVFDESGKCIRLIVGVHDITERKKAEQKLRKSETFNLGVLNSLSSHIAVIDALGNIIAVNEAWQQFSMENGETTLQRTGVGSNYFDVCKKSAKSGDELATDTLKGIMDVLQVKQNNFFIEYPCHSPYEQRWFSMRAKRFEGDEEMVVVSHVNITERRNAQKKVSESEARLAEAQSIAKIGNWETDLKTLNVIWSDETFRIFEVEVIDNELSHPNFIEYVHPEDRAKVDAAFISSFESNSINVIQHRILTPSHEMKIIEERWKIMKDDHGNPIRALGTCQDVTERKQIEDKLQLTQFAFDKAGDAIFWMTSDSRIVNVNEAACNSLGYTNKELLKLSVPDIDPDFNMDVWSAFFPQLREKHSVSIETIQQRKDGSLFPVEIRSNYIKFGDKEFSCAFVRDISERKKVEHNLEQQNKELQKTNTELDRFVYSTSHDLRAPLASLLGLIDIATDDLEPSNELQMEYMGMMKQSVLKLDNFISDILDYSRNARKEFEKDDIVFEDMIQEVLEKHKFMETVSEFELNIDVNQKAAFSSDKRRISVVLNNLISNAIKYKDESKENSFVIISVQSDKKKATIIIEDNGIGVTEKDKKKIFEMFYRGTKQSKGSGLGLYIVQETIDKLGATMALESEKSIGSKFTITITNLHDYES